MIGLRTEPQWPDSKLPEEGGRILPMQDPLWGPLRGHYQFLIAVSPPMMDDKIRGVILAVQEQGGLVVGYLPDHMFLAVGPQSAAKSAKSNSHVDWVGMYLPRYKVAPEWEDILTAVADNSSLNHVLSGGLLEVVTEKIDDPREGIFGAVHVDSSGLQQRLVIEVQFPSLLATQTEQLKASGPYKPGQAAVRDWGPSFTELFDGAVDLKPEHGTLQVIVPPELLAEVLELLSLQPGVHWLQPGTRAKLHNWRASSIIQSGKRNPKERLDESFELHPIWAAGIKGEGQIVGVGDSGVDVDSCYFYDPEASFEQGIKMQVIPPFNTRVYENRNHRKIVFYQGTADLLDHNGHGTHVVGSLLGEPYSEREPEIEANRGMAPAAKVAFVDLGSGSSQGVFTPKELSRFYYPNTYEHGARIHSDSWGSDSPTYDILSSEVDKFSWTHPYFLPIFAAGNYGEFAQRFRSTVTAPATAKNCLSVGATLTSDQQPSFFRRVGLETWEVEIKIQQTDRTELRRYRILEARFGGSWQDLRDSGERLPLVAGSPAKGCTQLNNDVQGTIVVLERGDCQFVAKMRNVQERGGRGVIVTNNMDGGGYNEMSSEGTERDLIIPMASVPQSIGRHLWALLQSGQKLTVKVESKTEPQNTFDNIAEYSSNGPTLDNRFKPDIVAPGRTTSAMTDGTIGRQQCSLRTMSGTSMATPVVAGAAALVRQYFMDGFYPSGKANDEHRMEPTSALIKAALLGGAFPMDGFSEAGLPLEPPPSSRQGFGRVHLERSIPVDGSSSWAEGWRLQIVDSAQLSTGSSHEYCVRAQGGPLRVTLVWTDPPASPSAGHALVNDLDLVVRSAGLNGEVLLGNGVEDRRNNVEQVWMDTFPEGNVAIMVRGHNVPVGNDENGRAQPYALVVHGKFSGILQSPHNPAAMTDSSSGACVIVVAVIKKGPEGPTADPQPEFNFTTESGALPLEGFECQLALSAGNTDGGSLHDWRPCTSPVKYDALDDDAYRFSVRPTGENVIATRDFVVDSSPPSTLVIGERLPEQSALEKAEFVFVGVDTTEVTFQCRLNFSGPQGQSLWRQDGGEVTLGEWMPCLSPLSYNGLSFGRWSFEVMATDSAGNVERVVSPQEWSVVYNKDQLYARIASGPLAIVPSDLVTFDLKVLRGNGEEAPDVLTDWDLECSLVNRAADGSWPTSEWEPCPGQPTYNNLTDGSFLFQARPVDNVTLSSDSVTELTFQVDRTPPNVTLTQWPDAFHAAHAAIFKFEANEEVKEFNCSLTSGEESDFGTCDAFEEGTAQYTLDNGEYIFQVMATDLVGNQGTSDKQEFMVDTEPPQITMVEYRKDTNINNISFSFEVFDGEGSGVAAENVSCMLRNESQVETEWLAKCTSPVAYTRPEGKYVFNVRAVDRARLSNDPQDYVVTVDQTPPTSRITQGPPPGPQPAFVSFKLAAEDEPVEIASQVDYHECLVTVPKPPSTSIDDEAFEGSEASGLDVPGQENVRSRLQSTSDSVDSDATISIKDGPTVTLGIWVQCENPVIFHRMPSGQYEFRTRAVDRAGNVGNATDTILFTVDATLPIPGEKDSGSQTPSWMWYIIAAVAGFVLLLVIVLLVRRRTRTRTRHRQQPATYQYYSGSTGQPLRQQGSDTSSDNAMAAAVIASVQQQDLDTQRVKLEEERDRRRMAAAMAASKDEYNLEQALKLSMMEQQAAHQEVAGQPSAPTRDGDDLQRAIALSLADTGPSAVPWSSSQQWPPPVNYNP